MAHRIAWRIKNGPVPDGLWVLHTCDVRACCNTDHLFLGTRQDNMDDMVKKNRSAHGVNGGNVVLTEAQVLEIVRLCRLGLSHRKVAKKLGIKAGSAYYVMTGQTWKRLTGITKDQK